MSKFTDDEIAASLNFDPLAAAEQITGRSYKEDDGVGFLGMTLMANRSKALDAMLAGDTRYGMKMDAMREIAKSDGYRQVLVVPLVGTRSGEGLPESLEVWFDDRRGILLVFSSYMTTGLNEASVYYNWKPTSERWRELTSSGGLQKGVWCGDHDARDAMRFNMRRLEQNGEFVTPWVHRPYLSLMSYPDWTEDAKTDLSSVSRIRDERLAMLPEDVRAAITCKDSVDRLKALDELAAQAQELDMGY